MATATVACGAHRPSNAEPLSQLVGYRQEFLVRANPHMLVFHLMKCLQQTVLVLLGKRLVGHRKQAMVLLLDVLPQQADLGMGVVYELFDCLTLADCRIVNCLSHAPDM